MLIMMENYISLGICNMLVKSAIREVNSYAIQLLHRVPRILVTAEIQATSCI